MQNFTEYRFQSSNLLPLAISISPIQPKCAKSRTGKTQIAFAIPPLGNDLTAAPFDNTTLAVVGGGSVAALAIIMSLADPEKRRQLLAEEVREGDKEMVREYFNNSGFQRWKKIYGETDDVNRMQMDLWRGLVIIVILGGCDYD